MTYLTATYHYDFESAEIQELIAEFLGGPLSKTEQAKGLYLKIRDGWRYNPYRISFKTEHYTASSLSQKKEGHCIDKSILLIAGLRGLGIPARLHLAKVKNHIAVEKLTEEFGTNELTPHGYVGIFLNNKWVKASPAFNAKLCELCQVAPLEFDGENDSVFQSYNEEGKEFMEYLEDYGHFEDFPMEFIMQNISEHYPALIKKFLHLGEVSFK